MLAIYNGRLNWKIAATGQTYQDWYEGKLRAAGIESNDDE